MPSHAAHSQVTSLRGCLPFPTHMHSLRVLVSCRKLLRRCGPFCLRSCALQCWEMARRELQQISLQACPQQRLQQKSSSALCKTVQVV